MFRVEIRVIQSIDNIGWRETRCGSSILEEERSCLGWSQALTNLIFRPVFDAFDLKKDIAVREI